MRQRSLGDLWLFMQAYCLLLLIRLGLWLVPFERLHRWVEWFSQFSMTQQPPLRHANPNVVKQVVWAVDASARRMVKPVKCLARALTVKALLGQHNCPADLKIGVAKNQQAQLEAHAWIEVEGQVVIGHLPDLQRFKPLPTLPQG
ncbi:MAG TPA: lasso peptide biosynthesis B2 protein [Stenomitos sp.]